jgi:hypothetical protein
MWRWQTPALWGYVDRANLNQWTTYVNYGSIREVRTYQREITGDKCAMKSVNMCADLNVRNQASSQILEHQCIEIIRIFSKIEPRI